MFPYAAVNVAANKAANQNLSDHAYRTLQALIDYADELGICWPGIRLLVNDTRKCKEMVQQGLEELVATGCIAYIRRNARDKYTGQKLVNIYQISPVLLHIRPELEDEAWKSWNKAKGKEFALSYSGQDTTNTRASARETNDNCKQSIQHQQPHGCCPVNMGGGEATPSLAATVEEQSDERPSFRQKAPPSHNQDREIFRRAEPDGHLREGEGEKGQAQETDRTRDKGTDGGHAQSRAGSPLPGHLIPVQAGDHRAGFPRYV